MFNIEHCMSNVILC